MSASIELYGLISELTATDVVCLCVYGFSGTPAYITESSTRATCCTVLDASTLCCVVGCTALSERIKVVATGVYLVDVTHISVTIASTRICSCSVTTAREVEGSLVSITLRTYPTSVEIHTVEFITLLVRSVILWITNITECSYTSICVVVCCR